MSVWAARRARALALAGAAPHAAEILRCYASVTEAQERLAASAELRTSLGALSMATNEPLVSTAALPLDELVPSFDAFVGALAGVGPEAMVAEAARWSTRPDVDKHAALTTAFTPDAASRNAASFHPRAFAEAVLTTLAGRVLPTTADGAEPSGAMPCRVCAAAPLVATLRDLPGALGSRALVCGRCGTERRVRRLTCAYCGESSADRQRVHTAESVSHVRIDECTSCARYLKTVDLRRRGDAVPVVEDLATPELDLWARERGLTKGRDNLFGL